MDNLTDMRIKNRHMDFTCPWTHPKGSETGVAILNEEKVFQLRRLKLKGVSCKRMSEWVRGVCVSTIQYAVSGKNWKHVPFPRHERDTLEAHAG